MNRVALLDTLSHRGTHMSSHPPLGEMHMATRVEGHHRVRAKFDISHKFVRTSVRINVAITIDWYKRGARRLGRL